MDVIGLKCEYAVGPLGIDVAQPRFSWVLHSSRRAQVQSAYRIVVASSLEGSDARTGDKWDSGKVASDQSVNIPYEGMVLCSGERAWWRVRVWDGDGNPSPWSDAATFEMGLLDDGDWRGAWIVADDGISSPLLRREFTLDGPVAQARVYMAGLGYGELYINGERVGDSVLDPGQSYYSNDQSWEHRSRVLYVTHDVTAQVRPGLNAIGVVLGHGWYSAEDDIPPSPSHREPYADRPALILQLNVEHADGSAQSIVSDDSWRTSSGPIRYNDYSNGETYDARLEQPGWSRPGFADRGWSGATEVAGPTGRLVAQSMPPIKVVETREAVRILNPSAGVYVFDFGQNFSGWSRLRVSGPRGAEVKLRHATSIYEDGSLDARSNMRRCPDSMEDYRKGIGSDGSYHHCARQTDVFTLKGEGEEVWEPRFTLHGFRYVEMTGFPGEPTGKSLVGRVVRSALESVGAFSCSNPLINQIHSNVWWTLATSLQSVPQDASERSERVAWLGDPEPQDYIVNWDTASFWSKWMDDIQDSQKPDGDLPVICPIHWRRTWEPYARLPAWSSTYAILAWSLYWYYGDRRILEHLFEGLKALVGFFEANSEDHIVSFGLGDHMEPQAEGHSHFTPLHTPVALTSTAYYYYDAWVVAQAADLLGRTDDAACYSLLAEQISASFNARFLDMHSNQYGTGSQASNAIPLWLGLVPADRAEAVLNNIVRDVETVQNGHLSTGLLGTNALAQVLGTLGRADVMLEIATQTTYPSWGYMISKGATTVWETWDGDPEIELCRNMKMLCSIEKFFYQDLAGIRPAAAGYEKILIEPRIVGDLTSAEATIRTVRGPVAVRWTRDDESVDIQVSIPANARAELRIPRPNRLDVRISEGGQPVWQEGAFVEGVPGITSGRATGGAIAFDLGSGEFAFEMRVRS